MISRRDLTFSGTLGMFAVTALPLRVTAQGAVQRIIFPYPPGGSADVLARLLANNLGSELKTSYIVENKPGAAGRIGTAYAAKVNPGDGTILLSTVALMSVFPIVYPKLSYDPVADFVPLTQLARFDLCLIASPNVPVKSLADVPEWLKKNPQKGIFSSPAAGSLPHFLVTDFTTRVGVTMEHVPYAGTPPALVDLMSGHISFMALATGDAVQLHKDGKVKILATSGAARNWMIKDVPTFKEQGVDIEAYGWYAAYANRNTISANNERLSKVLQAIVKSDDIRARLSEIGVEPTGTTGEELRAIQAADFERWGPIIKASGFKPAD